MSKPLPSDIEDAIQNGLNYLHKKADFSVATGVKFMMLVLPQIQTLISQRVIEELEAVKNRFLDTDYTEPIQARINELKGKQDD